MSLKKTKNWERLAYMIFFLFAFSVIQSIVFFITIAQFFIVLASDGPNKGLQNFGLLLSNYTTDVMYFLTHNSEEKPFPFGPSSSNRYRSRD